MTSNQALQKEGRQMQITISLDQAKTALECVQADIELSEFGQVDYSDVQALAFYLRRAELLHRLKTAVFSAENE